MMIPLNVVLLLLYVLSAGLLLGIFVKQRQMNALDARWRGDRLVYLEKKIDELEHERRELLGKLLALKQEALKALEKEDEGLAELRAILEELREIKKQREIH